MPGNISYYFTLFKKFQVLDHVPDGSFHGNHAAPTGGFDLTVPNGPLVFIVQNNHSNSLLWQLLNAAYTNPGSTVGGIPAMPLGATSTQPPSWVEFQIDAPVPIVNVLANWIDANAVSDIPSGVINPADGTIQNVPNNIPAPFDNGVSLFVCSYANDPGGGPTRNVPANYWATSLIYLVDPNTGNIVTPATLNAGDEWFLVGVVGNRGTNPAGRYLVAGSQPVQSSGVVMVWNTIDSPGVELPALSNLDVTDPSPIYESYMLGSSGAQPQPSPASQYPYDVVGFRLNVQNVFNGIIAALNQAVANGQINLGGLTPEQWVKQSPAHLCAKIIIRQPPGTFPNVGDTPLTNPALAQKNLAPFELSINDTDPNPTNIVWKVFLTGTPFFLRIPDAGLSRLRLVTRLPEEGVQLQLGIPTETFERYFRRGPGRIEGFREIPPRRLCESHHGDKAKPFPEAVVFEFLGGDHVIEFPAIPEKHYLGMALGIEYHHRILKPGPIGEIDLVHRAEMPKLRPGTRCFDIEERIVGGFTLQLRAVDINQAAKAAKARAGKP